MTQLNEHGQPLNPRFNRSRLTDRAIDELIGLCKGTLADGIVSKEEARFLLAWMEANRAASELWPASVLYPRIRSMLVDNVLDEHEQEELLDLVIAATGGGLSLTSEDGSLSTALPLDDPPPVVDFSRRKFCLTGKFYVGTRNACTAVVEGLGGTCQSGPSKATDFLVIGLIGSETWIHSTHGRKIEKAVNLRSTGVPISIICEEYWVDAARRAGGINI